MPPCLQISGSHDPTFIDEIWCRCLGKLGISEPFGRRSHRDQRCPINREDGVDARKNLEDLARRQRLSRSVAPDRGQADYVPVERAVMISVEKRDGGNASFGIAEKVRR